MAYNNSETNPSAQGAFYQWNYFSQALGKLDPASGATPNITARDVQPKQETDWMRLAATAFTTGNKAYEVFQEHSYREAEEYMKTHSLEEYSKEMKEGKIPLQMDPVAFSRLKYLHGKMAFNIAEQQFQTNIQNRAYLNMNPEQLDAEHFKFMKEAQKTLLGDVPYANDDDYYFKQGFWEQSPENRLKAINDQQQVDNEYHIGEAEIQDVSTIKAVINDSNSTSKDIIAVIEKIFGKENPNSRFYSPERRLKMITDIVGEISSRANGVEILEGLDSVDFQVIPGTAGLKDVLGGVTWKALLVASGNSAFIKNAREWSETQQLVNDYVNKGNWRAIESLLQQSLGRSGGAVNNEVKFYTEALNAAKDKEQYLERQVEVNGKRARDEADMTLRASVYLSALASGADVPKSTVLDLPAPIIDKVWDIRRKQLPEGDPQRISDEQAYNMALNPSMGYNPAKAEITNKAEGLARALRSNIENAQKSSGYQVVEPKDLGWLKSIYINTKNKPNSEYDLNLLLSDVSPSTRADLIAYAELSTSGNISYTDIVKARASYNELMSTEEGRKRLTDLDTYLINTLSKQDSYGLQTTALLARSMLYHSGMDPQTAVNTALKEFQRTNLIVDGVSCPATMFNVRRETDPQVVMQTCMKGMLKQANEARKANGFEELTTGQYLFKYNVVTNTFDLLILDPDNFSQNRNIIGRMTSDKVYESYKEFQEAEAIDREKRRMNLDDAQPITFMGVIR